MDAPIVVSTKHIPPYYWPEHREKFIETLGPETLAITPNYRININVSPPFPGVVQDRVVNAVEAGVLLFSDSNFGIEEILTPGKDFIKFSFTDNDLSEKLQYYLAHPREAYDIAMSARATWDASSVPGFAYKQAIEHALTLRTA